MKKEYMIYKFQKNHYLTLIHFWDKKTEIKIKMIIAVINKALIKSHTFCNYKKKKWRKEKIIEKIKEDIIKAFKDEKTTVTNVLQKLLKDQVTI